ncbi:MAG: 4-hydroxy-tetrahydrodipicolinate reductase [Clostridia bacterium]|nr:4-hydroxy-tetrahydrodipicolinate reductase [Clostridia bacterium]
MKIIVSGIGGRMGKAICELASTGFRGAQIVAGCDLIPLESPDFPIYPSPLSQPIEADCIIDFSHHTGTTALLNYAVSASLPVVLATTGHTDEEYEAIKEAAKRIPVFHSANMSVGIALLVELAKTTAKAFPDANIEIIEKHHNRKLDAPSGTALLLANAIREIRQKASFVFGRHGQAKRTEEEIGIHAIRMGNIVGEHEVIVGTDTQTITLKHEAHSRALFAEGALVAADYLIGQSAGLYDMKNMLTEE